jgi:hypothetical protein
VSPRTTPLVALDDRTYWRRLLATVHPDRDGGDAELFVFLSALREHVASCRVKPVLDSSRRREGSTKHSKQHDHGQDRIQFDASLGAEDEFWTLTHRALSIGQTVEEPFRSLLALLLDCGATNHGRRADQQSRGATWKQVAYTAHLAGFNAAQRSRWYEIARVIPLSEAHAAHIINSLKRQAAA